MRINQYLAQATGISRRVADKEIALGNVLLGSKRATLGDQVEKGDKVTFKGKLIVNTKVDPTTIMLNKPAGYITSRKHDESDAPTVMMGGGGVPLRKFFFPAEVVTTNSDDLVIVGSGDREHPLSSTTTRDRIFVLKDVTGNDGSGLTTITNSNLYDATTTLYSAATGTNKGYFKDFLAGEKAVNAPLTAAGFTYYGTNQPTASNSCTANLGLAKGYRLDAFSGAVNFVVYDGGGLPPSPVAGVVNLRVQGESTETSVPFCIGCGGSGGGTSGCKSGSCGDELRVKVPTSRTRTYWYQEID